MTAQQPERFVLDGRAKQMFERPLHRLLARARIDVRAHAEILSTSCWRGDIWTWDIVDDRLRLLDIELLSTRPGALTQPAPDALRARILRAAASAAFPAFAHWFTGRLRIATGSRLVCSHQGWSSWHAREHVVTIRHGRVTRRRDVDTRAILECRLRRDARLAAFLNGETAAPVVGSFAWIDPDDESDGDW